jgi:hypothetical protein
MITVYGYARAGVRLSRKCITKIVTGKGRGVVENVSSLET